MQSLVVQQRVEHKTRVPASPWWKSYLGWLVGLVISGWSCWMYLYQRFTDGSDDPWGFVALLTALVLIPWRQLQQQIPAGFDWKYVAVMCPILIGVHWVTELPLILTAVWIVAIGVLVLHAGGSPALIGLLLMSLPLMASLDFYAGYPLRLATGWFSEAVLNLFQIPVQASGTILTWGEREVIVDAPCSGLRMLWFGGYLCFAIGAHYQLRTWALLFLCVISFSALLFANGIRAVILFFPESGWIAFPGWAHEGIGLVIFAAAGFLILSMAGKLYQREQTV